MLTPLSSLLLVASALSGAATAPKAQPAELEEPLLEVAHELFEGLVERWQRAMQDSRLPGMSVVCVLDDEIVLLAGFGERDVERHLPVTPDTPFYIASATKPFVALILCALAGEDAVDLDAPVQKYLPRFALADARASEQVSVRQLLCHAPGINSAPIVLLDAYTGEITEDRFYHFLGQVEPLGEVSYSNVHFTLAGRVIEAVTGRSWRDELEYRLFEPLGMRSTTGYADDMYSRDNVALPSVRVERKYVSSPVRKTDRTMHAAGGLGTSARDVGQWLRLNLNLGSVDGKRVCAEELVQEMQTLHSPVPGDGGVFDEKGFGLGWQISEYEGGVQVLQHGGGYVGSSSLISFMPEIGAGVGVLVNTDVDGGSLCRTVTADLFDRILGVERSDMMLGLVQSALRPRPAPREASATLAAQDLSLAPAAYAGTYVSEHLGTFVVEHSQDGFSAQLGQLRLALEPRDKDAFRATSLNGPEAEGFFELKDGVVLASVLDVFNTTQRFVRQD